MSGEGMSGHGVGRDPRERDGGDGGSGSAPKRRRIGDAADVEMEEAEQQDDQVELRVLLSYRFIKVLPAPQRRGLRERELRRVVRHERTVQQPSRRAVDVDAPHGEVGGSCRRT